MLKVLVVVDHAIGISGPHRNVVGSLNALAAREDVSLRLLCGRIDENEPYAKSGRVDIRLGFDPHNPRAFFPNLRALRRSAKCIDAIYCPTGLKSFLYCQTIRPGRRFIAGPNVTPLPIRKADSPGRVEVSLLCDLWLEASRAKYDNTVKHTGPAKIRQIPHALNTKTFSPEKRNLSIWSQFGISEESLKIVFVGKDSVRRKGVPELLQSIEIFDQLHSDVPVDFVLVGRMSDATRKRVSSMSHVHLLGFQKGEVLTTIYASADIAVVPSSWENFAFTVLEAMSSGLALIATRSGGIPEQLEDGKSGMLIDIVDRDVQYRPDASEIIADAMWKLVNDPELRKSYGSMARARVQECFSEELLGRRLMAALSGEKEDNLNK
jgi:glycosyltransferase involved in cell wall biosynthesis